MGGVNTLQKGLVLAAVLALLSGCTIQYTLDSAERWLTVAEVRDHHQISRQRSVTIPVNSSVCVAAGNSQFDERFSQDLVYQSHRHLSARVAHADALDVPQSKSGAIRWAYQKRCDFLLFTELVLYRDKVSSLVEIDDADDEQIDIGLDRLWLQLSVWDVNSQVLVDVALLRSRNAFFTFLPHKPENLSNNALLTYLEQLVAFTPEQIVLGW